MPRNYEVEVRTGDHDHAGTNAGVRIQLLGGMGTSGEDRLDNPNVDDFQRGHTDRFRIADRDVGWINKIRLFHDNRGEHPGWYVDYAKVKYPELGLEVEADFYRWLARSEGDGEIDVTRDILVPTPTYSGGFLEKTYLGYEAKRKSNDAAGAFHFADEFIYSFMQGVSLQLSKSKSISTHASLSASFFGIGSSFEGTVVSATSRQFSTSASESFTSKVAFETDLQPGQAVTVIALYFQDVLTGEAMTVGITAPFEQRFAVTADLYVFTGILSDAEVRQKVVDLLTQIIGAPAQPHAAGQKMDLRFARESVPAPLDAASVARVRQGMRMQLKPSQLALVRGASSLLNTLRITKQPH